MRPHAASFSQDFMSAGGEVDLTGIGQSAPHGSTADRAFRITPHARLSASFSHHMVCTS